MVRKNNIFIGDKEIPVGGTFRDDRREYWKGGVERESMIASVNLYIVVFCLQAGAEFFSAGMSLIWVDQTRRQYDEEEYDADWQDITGVFH